MHPLPYLHDVVVLFVAALVVTSLSHRLRVPPVVGFLATGVLVGPGGLALVRETAHVELFAELGVVFLLFVIGLEFSPERLRSLGRFVFLAGPLQVAVTTALVAGTAVAFGDPAGRAVYLGLVVALSSTAIVLKLYFERRELESPHGRIGVGVLLFQDFLIVPALLVVPLLAGAGGASGVEIALRFGGGLLLVAAAFAGGRFALPPVLRLIVHTRVRELFVLGALAACLGAALLTEALGFSFALGSFLAGILIAETEYHHQVQAEIAPFRDVFNSVFFISIGMLVEVGFVAVRWPLILAVGLGLLALKAAVLWAVVRLLRFPARTALLTALGLAQIGEFSFVLIRAGEVHGLLGPELYRLAIATAVLTMVLTPALIALGPRLVARSRRRGLPGPDQGLPAERLPEEAAPGELAGVESAPEEVAPAALTGHVVVAGFGLNGRHLARVLKAARVPYRVVDLNGRAVRRARQEGEPVLWGDVTRRAIQEACGVPAAAAAVFALSDPPALRQAVRLARYLNPELFIVVRTRQMGEIDELRRAGADEVIAEELESSIEIVTRVLRRLHLPGNVIRAEARMLRGDAYQMLRSPAPDPGLSGQLARILAAGATETFLLPAGSPAAGRSLRELDLRRATGITVIAVVRGETPHPNPATDFVLQAGDVLVLVGSHTEIDQAFHLLAGRG